MSWYEIKNNESLGQKQDLKYSFQFHDLEEQKKTNNLKRKREDTPTSSQTQDKTNYKDKTTKTPAKQETAKKKQRKSKITKENFI